MGWGRQDRINLAVFYNLATIQDDDLLADVSDHIKVVGIRVVQAFVNEDHERRLFAESNRNYLTTKLEAYKVMAASMSLSYLSMRSTEAEIADAVRRARLDTSFLACRTVSVP